MSEKIAVIIDFLTSAYEKQLRDTAARCGYEIVFFPSSRAAERAIRPARGLHTKKQRACSQPPVAAHGSSGRASAASLRDART